MDTARNNCALLHRSLLTAVGPHMTYVASASVLKLSTFSLSNYLCLFTNRPYLCQIYYITTMGDLNNCVFLRRPLLTAVVL
jgi:hypothetical protein